MPKLLLVEDNPENSEMLTRRLTRRGYDVVLAADGLEAVENSRTERPDLILMVMNLPTLDGWEATRQVRATPDTATVPILALTAHGLAGDREKSIAAGCDDHHTKPVELARLLEQIEALLGRDKARA